MTTTRAPLAALLVLLAAGPAAAAEPVGNMTRALEELASGKKPLAALHVRVDWLREGEMTTAVVHGNGVGIWGGRVQVRFSPDDVRHLLGELRASGFASMPSYEGKDVTKGVKMRGKLEVAAGDARKTVVQLLGGPQSEKLQWFVAHLLALAEARVRGGAAASSLDDGLAKLAAGALAPETLEVVVQRRPESAGATEAGFLLRVDGNEAVARSFRPKEGYGAPRTLTLAPEELRPLVEALRAARLEEVPASLYADDYTELRVQVLNRGKEVQARRALGLTRETHGEKQRAFDAAFETARRLAGRVLSSGAPG